MMAFTQPSKRGQWVEEKVLGSGGFGQVVLWKNEETGNFVALKKCRVQSEMTQKHRERWTLEVDIMQRLNHRNVVAAKDVPPVLNVGVGELPLLAMEYCSGGDLRRVLNKPENCVGLREFDIRCLVKDVASAVEYLHSKRIIHRDLKPENIVLQMQEEQIVYKLIDLGYAKELDQGSVCTSFVGTLQYLAPELFASQKYTCTVDYWSFGTVVFECITGFRPFIPQVPPVTWHREVCKKSLDDITAFYNAEGVVKFSKKLITPTHLCRSMQAYFEQWLRYMLKWDPKARGGGLSEGRPQCFKILDTMLSIKIVHILYVANNQLLSYPLLDNYSLQALQQNIEKETGIKFRDQDILLASGASPDPNLGAQQCWNPPGEEDWVVFLFVKGENQGGGSQRNKPLPPNVQNIVKDSKTVLPYNEQKRAWAEAVYFCSQQVVDFRRLIQSQRAAMLSLLRTNSSFLKMKNSMVSICDHLLSKMVYFKECLQHDLEMYEIQKSNGVHNAEKVVAKWMRVGEEIEVHRNLKEKVAKLDQHSIALQTKIIELQKSPFARAKQNEVLEELEKKAVALYHDLRQAGGREIYKDHTPMVQIVVKCLITRDKSLQDLYTHLGKICACKHELFQLLPSIQQCSKQITDATGKLLQSHKERQSDIWNLVQMAAQNGISRQDSKGSNSASSWGVSSLESMKVCDDNRETVKKVDGMIRSLMEEQDENMSMMDWSFLPPLKNNSS
ncbi:inhibitor of nuclear factor kappa-B kinase subunit alpha-like isoform X2 [Ostrea edulis]|uniref:inhibitor of nuclear factor kappa-B kinase subunit alpha-like isoform X2 n=1 Tax=Ostrea edulis TaxID=37623 RepID=UPI0020946D80|nr:inhibitor of nuclear factor kappa-B kinase subunit alpha-like isoform X2 [Ostrea edulis]